VVLLTGTCPLIEAFEWEPAVPQPNGLSNQGNLRPKNRLLAGLPDADFARLKPHLQTVPVGHRQVRHHANEPVSRVFFLNGGMASITTAPEDGTLVEVAVPSETDESR
jgi:hypothetical protein